MSDVYKHVGYIPVTIEFFRDLIFFARTRTAQISMIEQGRTMWPDADWDAWCAREFPGGES